MIVNTWEDDALISVDAVLKNEDGIQVALAIQRQRPSDAEGPRFGVIDTGSQGLTTELGGKRVGRSLAGRVVVCGGQIGLGLCGEGIGLVSCPVDRFRSAPRRSRLPLGSERCRDRR